MRKSFLISFFTFLVFFSSSLYAASYHVATTGNDGNAGTLASPWISLTHACDMMSPGDTTFARGGFYENPNSGNTDGQTCNKSGTSSAHITITNYQNEIPIFTASKKVTSWTNTATNIWQSPLVSLSATLIWGAWRIDADGTVNILSRVNGQTCNASNLTADNQYCSTGGVPPSDRIYIYSTTDPNTLVSGGAVWRVVGTNSSFTLPTDTQYVDVDGIKTQFGYVGFNYQNGTSHTTLANSTTNYNANWGMAISTSVAHPTTDILWSGNTVTYTVAGVPNITTPNQHGFKLACNEAGNPISGSNIRVENSESSYNNYHGFQFSECWQQVYIVNSRSHHNCNYSGNSDCSDIRVGTQQPSSDWVVENNTVHDSKYGIVMFGRFSNSSVSKNLVYNESTAGIWLDDNGATPFGQNNIMSSNIIRDGAGYGILVDYQGDGGQVYNNTIVNNTGSGIRVGSGVTTTPIKNNIVISPSGPYVVEILDGANPTFNNNAYYSPDSTPFFFVSQAYNFSNYKTASGRDANSVNSDFRSEFVNYSANNFVITTSSNTLKDAGATLTGTIAATTNDFRGLPRPQGSAFSIGAYEEGSTVEAQGVTINGVKFQ